jgi:hypothetical protein
MFHLQEEEHGYPAAKAEHFGVVCQNAWAVSVEPTITATIRFGRVSAQAQK